ncbi:glycogen-binding domain-containing protein, partial [Candidatus Riflebacteria bacterium]
MKSPQVFANKVTFNYQDPDANTVSVVGSFNNWNATDLIMQKVEDGKFSAEVQIPFAGVFQYKFVVNGENWIE